MSMGRIRTILGFSVPPSIKEEVEQVAREERRTKSELFREVWRMYLAYRKRREQIDDAWVMKLIEEAKAEQTTNPMTQAELEAEDERLLRSAAKRAKKLGLFQGDETENEEAVNRIVHESRTKWRHGA
jgi:metal-responsive CopG/Arc/MetJ family transcriptional regulator